MKSKTLITALSATIALGVLALPLTSCATKTTKTATHKSVKHAKCGANKAGKTAKCGANKANKTAKCGTAKCGAHK